MKSHEILREDDTQEENPQLMFTQCSDAINEMQVAGTFLFRGVTRPYRSGRIYSSGIRAETKDTPASIQRMVDQVLDMAGFEAKRSDSVYCSGDFEQAEEYGEVFMIFPLNGYQITWSRKFKDFYSDFAMHVNDPNAFLVQPNESYKIQNDYFLVYLFRRMQNIRKSLGVSNLSPDDERLLSTIEMYAGSIPESIAKNDKIKTKENLAEIYYAYRRYLRISPDRRFVMTKEMLKALQTAYRWANSPSPELNFETAIATVKGHMFTEGDLASALDSGHEIYLKGKFYAFDMDTYGETFKRLIQEW
jgi:hypothetical protein